MLLNLICVYSAYIPRMRSISYPLSPALSSPVKFAVRLDQIGLVDALAGDALQGQLRPGQRLVSGDGELWRWEYGDSATANTTSIILMWT